MILFTKEVSPPRALSYRLESSHQIVHVVRSASTWSFDEGMELTVQQINALKNSKLVQVQSQKELILLIEGLSMNQMRCDGVHLHEWSATSFGSAFTIEAVREDQAFHNMACELLNWSTKIVVMSIPRAYAEISSRSMSESDTELQIIAKRTLSRWMQM